MVIDFTLKVAKEIEKLVVKGVHENNEINYYGVVQDIIEVVYLRGRKRVVLFKCDWFDSELGKGLRFDKECKMYSINVSSQWYKNQQYVLASQVNQVFYIPDLKLGGSWYIIQSCSPQNAYHVPENEHVGESEEVFQEEEPNFTLVIELPISDPSLARGLILLKELDSAIVVGSQTIASSRTYYNDHESLSNDDSGASGEFGESKSEDELLMDDSTLHSC